jgi:hypothetical protein
MKAKYNSYIAVCVTSLILSIIYCPPYDIYFDDKEIFKYCGFLIGKGQVPYKDFFDHKPPLIFFFNYFGSLLGSWGLWVIDAFVVLFVSLQFLKLNIKYHVRFPAILPILFNLILRNWIISFGVGMTREYTTIALLLACCVILSQSRYKNVYLGFLASFIFFMQQEQIVILVPFIVYSFWKDMKLKRQNVFRIIALFLLGSFIVTLLLLLYFQLNSALFDFWSNAFLFNTQWYTAEEKPGFIRQVITLKNYIYELNLDVVLIGALIMSGVSFFVGHERKGLLVASLIAIPLSFISEFLSGKLTIGNANCTYYLLPLSATLPFLLFVVFAFTKQQAFQNRLHQLIYSTLFIAGLVMSMAMYVVNYNKYPHHGIAKSREMEYLKAKTVKDYELYVFNHSNFTYAYNYFKVLPPSSWLYHYFWSWYPNWDQDSKLILDITKELKQHKTKYIIYDPQRTSFLRDANYRVWQGFVDSNYIRVPGLIVWEAK